MDRAQGMEKGSALLLQTSPNYYSSTHRKLTMGTNNFSLPVISLAPCSMAKALC